MKMKDDDDDLSCLSAFAGFFFARGLIANVLDFLDDGRFDSV